MLKSTAQQVDPNLAEGLRAAVAKVEQILNDFRTEATRLKASDEFSKTGVVKRIAEVAQHANDRLAKLEGEHQGYGEHIEQLQRAIKPATTEGDAVLQHLRERELRDQLRDTDQLELQVQYEQACREGGSGSELLAAAIENSPLPMLPPEVLEGGQQARALRQSPAEAAKLRDLRRVRDTLEQAIRAARSELEQAGLPGDDIVTRIARGEAD